jgi:hypothetical protein
MSKKLVSVLGVLGLAVVCTVVWAVLVALPNQLRDDRFDTSVTSPLTRATIEEKRLKSRNDIRTAGAQLLAALAVLGGGVFTWWTVRLTREGQLTDRFTNAVEHLGHEETPVRVGAIYALGRIARDSRTDRGAVMALLADHLREKTPWPPPPADDKATVVASIPLPHPEVRAVARILRERSATEVRSTPLALSGIDLRSAPLEGANLCEVDLADSNLAGAHLEGADLSTARKAVIEGAETDGRTRLPTSG